MTIIPAYNKSEIAFRYYLKKWPERSYHKAAARKQFAQDLNIDRKILQKVIDEVTREQKAEIKESIPR